ncbi:AbrB/MazE/SpoVT family DNA-binding domain-containing protein [Candidatus Saccharibacteria bacterium]|nr:AbrB/MazE/SpoVT family DNA-binding domain-containing protein [Candidatus Saccharibacteria bacterium]
MDSFKFYGSATVGTKGQIVIPAEARDELNFKEGDKVVIMKSPMHDGLMMLKAEVFEQHLNQMQHGIEHHRQKMADKENN